MRFPLLLCFLAITAVGLSQSSYRVALVIGAQNYTNLPPLHNSLNDARALSAALTEKGFQVESLYDPRKKEDIRQAITRYFKLMEDKAGATGIIYYAGHGMQYEGENYIIPTTAKLDDPASLDDDCVKMNTVMTILRSTNQSLNILMLDACRSLPGFTRGSDVGLTRMEPPEGSIVVFATQPGKVASDGTGKNGLFTSKLLEAIQEPHLNLNEILKKVKQEVYEASGSKQLPSVEDNSIGGDFYFTPASPAATTKVNTTNKPPKVIVSSAPVKKEPTEEQKEAMRLEKRIKERGAVQPKNNKMPAPTQVTYKTVPAIDFGNGPITKVLSIGNQVWAPQNLNLDHFANGAPIATERDNFKWWNLAQKLQPLWTYFDNDSKRDPKFGKLYNFYAVTDPRGLCPTGWHVPTNEEFRELTGLFGNTAGKVLKADDTWQDNINGEPGTGTDDVGFAAYPTGRQTMLGTFLPDGHGWYWTSTINTESPMPIKEPFAVSFAPWSAEAFFMENPLYSGLAVRCMKDQ